MWCSMGFGSGYDGWKRWTISVYYGVMWRIWANKAGILASNKCVQWLILSNKIVQNRAFWDFFAKITC